MQTFILLCTNFVLLMTIPGLALFYGGLSQAPNVLATVMHSFSIMCVITLLWMFVGYTISFDQGPSSNSVVGGPDLAWLKNVINQDYGSIPHVLFIAFQGTFAVITVQATRTLKHVINQDLGSIPHSPRACICMYVCIYVCMYICMYACMLACLQACMNRQRS